MKNTGLFLLSSAVLFLISCDFFSSSTNYFSEYNGVNLLSTGTELGNWEWAEDTDTSTAGKLDADGYSDYALFSETSTSGEFEFRIPNLFKDGDFENGVTISAAGTGAETAATTDWYNLDKDNSVASTGAIDTLTNFGVTGTLLENNVLHYDITTGTNDYMGCKLSYFLEDGLKETTYYYLMDYNATTSNIYFQIIPTTTDGLDIDRHSWITGNEENGESGTNPGNLIENSVPNEAMFTAYSYDMTEFSVKQDEEYYFILGKKISGNNEEQEAYIDNIRFIRTDLTYKLYLDLTKETLTSLPLVSGYYQFTIDVKLSADAETGNNRNHLPSIELEIAKPGESGGITEAQPVVTETFDLSAVTSSDWTTLTISCGIEDFIQISDTAVSAATAELYLGIGSNQDEPSPGTILFSNPKLYFSGSPY